MQSRTSEASRHRGSVLVVDDDAVILFTMAEALRRAGFEVLEASSAEDALQLLKEKQPDIAVLDIRMPGMSGMDLCQRLRQNTDIPFLFLTAFDDADIVKLAAEQGAVGYLVKPILPQQLVPSIEAGLARAREIRELRDTSSRLRHLVHSAQHTSMAAGILMERNRLNRQDAFQALRTYARDRRRKLDEVAVDFLDAAELLNAQPRGKSAPES